PEGLVCLDLKGNTLWKTEKAFAVNRGNILLVDGKLLSMGGADGVLRLAEASPAGYKQLAAAKLFDMDERDSNHMWAPLVLSDGHLIVRDQNQMKCLDLRPR